VGIIVQPGQTLESIAQDYNITPEALAQGNCLTDEVIPGMLLFVPPLQPTTRPTEPCGRPPGWVSYVVQSGDTLYSLAVELNVTVYQLQVANCMIGQTTIHTGQALWVPRLPVRTTPTLTEEPTDTEVPPTETSEPTDTPEPTATNPNNPPDSP
jgi:LysM repeat protein